MSWPTCEEGFRTRKLTTFAGGVVSDFKSLPFQPRKVVVLQEDSPEIYLEDLDLKAWGSCLIRFLAGEGGSWSNAKMYFNGDLNEGNYWGQAMVVQGAGLIRVQDGQVSGVGNLVLTALGGQGTIGPPPGPDRTTWLIWVLFSAGRVRAWIMGDNNLPTTPYWGGALVVYAPVVENLTSITLFSGDPSKPYKAGTRVEVW